MNSNNKKIYCYMGGKSLKGETIFGDEYTYWEVLDFIPSCDYDLASAGIFKFHSDWNWLMPVVFKLKDKITFPSRFNTENEMRDNLYNQVINILENENYNCGE